MFVVLVTLQMWQMPENPVGNYRMPGADSRTLCRRTLFLR